MRVPHSAATTQLLAAMFAAALSRGVAAADEPRVLSQSTREVWTYRDGLPHNVVHRLIAARTGYLWIGTQEGLVRFDGVRFRTFSQIDTPGLAGNEITAFLEDERGILWIGTSLGLSRLTGDAFQLVDLGGVISVSALAPDGEGGLWVGTHADGVRRVRAGEPLRVESLAATANEQITVLRLGSAGELWIGSHAGLARLVAGRLEALGSAGLPSPSVRAILEDDRGTVWVGTPGGLARRRPGAALFEPVPSVREQDVYALLQDRAGDLWVGTGPGLLRLRGDRVEAANGSASPTDVHALAEDAEDNIWVGTETGGLQRLRWGQVITVGREEGLSAEVVWTVREGRDGAMWFGTDGGLDRMLGGPPQPAYEKQMRGAGVAALLEDRAGDLWVGTTGGGVLRFGPRGLVQYGKGDGLDQTMVRVLHEDARGTIWVGTTSGLFQRVGGRFAPVPHGQGLAGQEVNTLAEQGDGTLWVGTTTGLARVRDGRLDPALVDGRPDRSDVTALLADPDGSLWLGTVGAGLNRLRGDRLTRLTRREGLHEDTVLGILDDGLGHLWLSGNHGITRVGRADVEEFVAGRRLALAPTILARADGMRERECNGGVQPSAWRASDGRLWFATIRGAVVVDPARVRMNTQAPSPLIEEFVVDGQQHALGGPLRLAPGTRRLDIRYTGMALAVADRIRFRHRLEGLESAFFDAGSERVARYTNLAPGRYVFHVVAANENGVWGTPGASAAFEIRPYFWQTSWFYATAGAAALGMALGAHRLRTRALRRREAELKTRVEEEMGKVKMLTGLLPICAWCKRIRDDAGQWHRIESFVSSRTEAQFTHAMCPECYSRDEGGSKE
jgi:ligand-binding sensor domain-containing protein